MNFRDWIHNEGAGNIVFHVTYLKNIDGIAEKGLQMNNPNNFPGYIHYSKNRNFFSNSLQRSLHWVDQLQKLVNHNYEPGAWVENNFVEENMIPIILKFRFNRRGYGESDYELYDRKGPPIKR